MKEILAGGNIQNAFDYYGIAATCNYRSDKYEYQVWQLAETEFDRLNKITEDDWFADEEIFNSVHGDDAGFGWWRYCEGSNIRDSAGYEVDRFSINGHAILAYYDWGRRDLWIRHIYRGDSGIERELTSDEYMEAAALYMKSHSSFHNLVRYSFDEIGASTEKNFCAVAAEIAKLNHMTMAELFEKTLG